MGRAIRGSTILFSEMTPQPAWEEAFNDWYDREHIPLRMACPGFLSAQRYRSPVSRNYLAVYEMTSPDDLRTPQYARVKGEPSELTRSMLSGVGGFTRYIATESDPAPGEDVDAMAASGLLATFCRVEPGARGEFAGWAARAHPPTLPAGARVRSLRRLAIGEGDPGDWTDLLLFYLEGEALLAATTVEPPAVAGAIPTQSQFFVRHGARQLAA